MDISQDLGSCIYYHTLLYIVTPISTLFYEEKKSYEREVISEVELVAEE